MDNGNEINFNFIAFKIKEYKCTLTQKESIAALTISIALIIDTAFAVTGNTKNVKFPYCTHCHKFYYIKKKHWMLYLHLKQQAKAEKNAINYLIKRKKLIKIMMS